MTAWSRDHVPAVVDGGVQLFGHAGERVAGVAEPVGHLLPGHAHAAIEGHLDHLPVIDDFEAEAGPGQFHPHEPYGLVLRWLVGSPEGASPWKGRQLDRALTERRLSGV